jgi:ABC-type multidrug transport system ATPase subunit
MNLQAVNLGKRFNTEWIFKDLTISFAPGKVYAITGPNGSGKSTLLRILWGQLPPTAGEIRLEADGSRVTADDVYKYVSIATPYMDLIDEFTLHEMIAFHFKFKKPIDGNSVEDLITLLELDHARDKAIGNFSSGMKQRLKLGLAFSSDTPLLFLDEPLTNLDENSHKWYLAQLATARQRLVIIASNQAREYPEDAIKIDITAFKAVTKTGNDGIKQRPNA